MFIYQKLLRLLTCTSEKEDIIEQGGLKSVVALLSSQTTALQVQAAKAIGSLAADGTCFSFIHTCFVSDYTLAQAPVVEALRALNVHITVVKLIGNPITQDLLIRLLGILISIILSSLLIIISSHLSFIIPQYHASSSLASPQNHLYIKLD